MHKLDHRHLATDISQQRSTEGAQSKPIDAIYVVTQNRPWVARHLVETLEPLKRPIRVLASTIDDFPFVDLKADDLDIFLTRQSAFDEHSPLLSHRFADQAARQTAWDIGVKRNAALAYSLHRDESRILLLDDDIRFLDNDLFHRLERALDSYELAGALSVGKLDNSFVSHALRLTGKPQETFLSGNCLALRLDNIGSFFPPIYNEDRLFMFDVLTRGQAAIVGDVEQLSLSDDNEIHDGNFQEAGDTLMEGLYALLPDSPDRRLDIEYWQSYLNKRRQLITELIAALQPKPGHTFQRTRLGLISALSLIESIRPHDIVEYITTFESERAKWIALNSDPGAKLTDVCDLTSVRPKHSFDIAQLQSTPSSASDTHPIFDYEPGASITIVCPSLPGEWQSPLAADGYINHTRYFGLADLDAAIELYGYLISRFPRATVRICSSAEADGKLAGGHLILLGGTSWNSMTNWFIEMMNLPVKQRRVPDGDQAGDTFSINIDDDSTVRTFAPNVVQLNSRLTGEDVGFFARGLHPLEPDKSVLVCNGVLSRGVLGVVRALTDSQLGATNQQYLNDLSHGVGCALLMRVPIVNDDVLPADLRFAPNRLFEWSES